MALIEHRKCPFCGTTSPIRNGRCGRCKRLDTSAVRRTAVEAPPVLDPAPLHRCQWRVSHALPVPECGQPATHYDPATGACFCARHEQHYCLANGIRSLRALPPAPVLELTSEALVAAWLDSVNQPVVDDTNDRIRQLLDVVSDNDNFTPEQSRAILCSLVQTVSLKH